MIAAADNCPFLPPEIEMLLWGDFRNRWKWCEQPTTHAGPFDADVAIASDDCGEVQTHPFGPRPTRPIVHDAEEARTAASEVAASFTPGRQSLYFAKWPGVGGTTAFVRGALENLAAGAVGWKTRVAVHAFPRRDLAEEKAAMARNHAEEKGLDVLVVVLLGKSKKKDSGWWCSSEHFSARATQHRELSRSACVGCPHRSKCDLTAGHFRHERARVLDALGGAKRRDGPPVLIVTTHASLQALWPELPKKSPVVLDEASDCFGLTRELVLPWSEVDAGRENATEFFHREGRAGRSRKKELDRWRSWAEAAPIREEAWAAFRSECGEAHNHTEADEAAIRWATSCSISQGKARELVAKHWPDKARVLRALGSWLRSQDVLPEGLAADIVRGVLRALQQISAPPKNDQKNNKSREEGRRKRRRGKAPSNVPITAWLRKQRRHLAKAVASLSQDYREALMAGKVRPPQMGEAAVWPWEVVCADDGEDLRPAFAATAIAVAREVLEGRIPVVRRFRRDVHLWMPDHDLIQRAKAGYVVWIAVGPMPAQIRDALGVRQEVIVADPVGLDVVVLTRVTRKMTWGGFGPGERTRERDGRRLKAPSIEDEMTRDLATKLAAATTSGELTFRGSAVRSFGAVVHQVDCRALGRPKWTRYYNAGHEGTDDLLDCQMLLVRRWMPPFDDFVLLAEIVRRTLGIAAERGRAGVVGAGERRWWYGPTRAGEAIRTACLADPLERGLQTFFELQGMLNAIGRCRPLSAGSEGRVVIFLNGRPLDWLRVTHGPYGIESPHVHHLLGVEMEIPSDGERDRRRLAREEEEARRVTERQGRLLELLEAAKREDQLIPSYRSLAILLSTSPRTLRRDLVELGAMVSDTDSSDPLDELRNRLADSLAGLRDRLREGAQRLDGAAGDVPGAEVAGVGRDSHRYIPMEPAPQAGHFGLKPLPEDELRLLPGASKAQERLQDSQAIHLSDRAVRRHLADIRAALRGDPVALVPRRSDKRRSLGAVIEACLALLERHVAEEPSAAPPRVVEWPLPFETADEAVGDDAGEAADDHPPAERPPTGGASVERDLSDPGTQLAVSGAEGSGSPWAGLDLPDDVVEALEERAAIIEFDALIARDEAERRAWAAMVSGRPSLEVACA